MSIKHFNNQNSMMFKLDSALDTGSIYPFIEPCVVAGVRMAQFGELHFGHYIEAIMIAVCQNNLGNVRGASLVNTTYSNIQKAKKIVEHSIQNN